MSLIGWKNQETNDKVKFRLESNLMLIWVSFLFKPNVFFHCFLVISPPLWPNKGVIVLCFLHFIINFIIFKMKSYIDLPKEFKSIKKKDDTFGSRVLIHFFLKIWLPSLVPMVVPTKHWTSNVNSLKLNL